MSNLSVRGLDPATLAALKALATREGASINATVVRLLEHGLGTGRSKHRLQRYDDLDALAGRWSAEEGEAFDAAIAPFETIDPDLWK